jgi:membrane peptidoglycan carboxypeptidase
MVGYTPGIAMAVWIGDQNAQHPIQDATGVTIWGSGLPATIYRDVMNAAHQSMPVPPPATFPAASDIGNVNPPGSVPR